MKAVILAGGLGTRLMEETTVRPKPMVEIGGLPIIHHIMQIYASQGIKDFIVAAGYKGEMLDAYFENLRGRRGNAIGDLPVSSAFLNGNVHVNMSTGSFAIDVRNGSDWNVNVVDTGAGTMTGGRLLRLRELLSDETFMVTYGDGLSDLDLTLLHAHHVQHGRIGTLTAVHPPVAQTHIVTGRGGRVHNFAGNDTGWINGGYFVFEPEVFDYIAGDETVLEKDVLSALARDGELMAFRHPGFWQCMDTLEERLRLEALWRSGDAPWQEVLGSLKRIEPNFRNEGISAAPAARQLSRAG